MGVVYLAEDAKLRRRVALKVLTPRADLRDVTEARLLREARAAAAVAHPNIASIYEVHETRDGPFIAMEYIEGATLRERLASGPPAVEEALRVAREVAAGLAHAHARMIVHRDLKPDNVMLAVDGRVKILDFGIAKSMSEPAVESPTTKASGSSAPEASATVGRIHGTLRYMSPEQSRGEAVDARSDVFSFGVMLHEMLSGKEPFALRDTTKRPRTWGGGDSLEWSIGGPLRPAAAPAPPDLEAFVARCLAFDREGRFADGAELVRALEGLGSGRRALAAPGDPGTRDLGGRKRLAIGAVIVGAVVFGAWVTVSRGTRSPAKGGSALGVAAPSRCASSAACTTANGGALSWCRQDGACVALASEDCTVHADPSALESDDTVWFGAMFPEDATRGTGRRSVDLAREDFVQMMSGFTRTRGDGHVHPIGVVACDDTRDGMRAARHLVADVGVPAIIGFQSAGELIDVGSTLLMPNGVIGVASLTTSPLVTGLPNPPGQPRLVWRTTYNSAETARAMGHVVPDLLEPQIRALPGAVVAGAPMRVAFVRTKSRGGSTFDQHLFNALRFNGKSAFENGSDYREIVFDESDESKLEREVNEVVPVVDRFAPHVIILVATEAVRFVEALERTWSHRAYRPRYLFMTALMAPLLDWIGRSAERRRRLLGITAVSTTPANARYILHYNESASAKVTAGTSSSESYDAFYLLAYATYALDDGEPVTGTNLARAIARLVPPGRGLDVGPAQIFDAYSALRRGESIDLNGASGALDFNLETGEAPVDQAVVCASLDARGRAADDVESGVVFRSAEDRLEGALRCP